MVACSVLGCRNSSAKGFHMKRFPRDPIRRKIWTINVKRKGWTPSDTSRLCEAHFTSDMFEQNRDDGKRMLKWNAIPTIFSHTPEKNPRKLPRKRSPEKEISNSIEEPSIPEVDSPDITSQTSLQPSAEISSETDEIKRVSLERDHNYSRMAFSTSTNPSSGHKSNCYSGANVAKKCMASSTYSRLRNALRQPRFVRILQHKEKDECDLYCRLLVSKLRKLPKHERRIIMNKIDGLLFERIYKNSCSREKSFPRHSFSSLPTPDIRNSPLIAQSSCSEHIINLIIPNLASIVQISCSDPNVNSIQPSSNMDDIEENQNRQDLKGRKYRQRKCWMTNIHRSRTREEIEQTFYKLLYEPSGEFDNFCCMTCSDFELLLSKISPMISKRDTHFRKAIPAKYRLAITLRYLASGANFKSLQGLFKVSIQSISKIIRQVCKAINEVLKDEIKMPSTAEGWMSIERGYRSKFPHCAGSLDAKHIVIGNPACGGTQDKKKRSSIVLMTLIDSNHRFVFAETGSHGRLSDGEFFNNSLLWQRISKNEIDFPPPCPLPGSANNVPYVFLADNPFALSTHIMKPYPGEHDVTSPQGKFNQHFTRSRVVVENTFGILSTVFRIFRRPIDLEPDTVLDITMTCVLLHNYIIKSESSAERYAPRGTFDEYDSDENLISPGSWRSNQNEFNAIQNVRPLPCRTPLNAAQIREEFASYFCRSTT